MLNKLKEKIKNITDDIVSRPSILILTISIIYLACNCYIVMPENVLKLWKGILRIPGYGGLQEAFYMFIVSFSGAVLLLIILAENLTKLRIKHWIVQNRLIKVIVFPVVLYYLLLLLLPSILFVSWALLFFCFYSLTNFIN